MAELFTNNATSILNGALNNVQATITLQTGTGSKFPAPTGGDYFYATLFSLVGQSEVNHEIVKVTARSGDVLTVVRGQQGTTARSWSDASFIQHRATKETLENLLQGIKTKKLTGTTGGTEGSTVTVYHGLNYTKILGVHVLINVPGESAPSLIPPNSIFAESQYAVSITDELVAVTLHPTASANILSKSFTALVIYEP